MTASATGAWKSAFLQPQTLHYCSMDDTSWSKARDLTGLIQWVCFQVLHFHMLQLSSWITGESSIVFTHLSLVNEMKSKDIKEEEGRSDKNYGSVNQVVL